MPSPSQTSNPALAEHMKRHPVSVNINPKHMMTSFLKKQLGSVVRNGLAWLGGRSKFLVRIALPADFLWSTHAIHWGWQRAKES